MEAGAMPAGALTATSMAPSESGLDLGRVIDAGAGLKLA
jgi:hypothetical protein